VLGLCQCDEAFPVPTVPTVCFLNYDVEKHCIAKFCTRLSPFPPPPSIGLPIPFLSEPALYILQVSFPILILIDLILGLTPSPSTFDL